MVNPLSYVKTQGQPQSVDIQARSSICCRMLSVSTENDFLLGATSGCVCENCRFVRGLCSGTLISFQMWELASLPPSSSASSLRRSIVPTSKDVLLRFYLRQRRWAPSAHQRKPLGFPKAIAFWAFWGGLSGTCSRGNSGEFSRRVCSLLQPVPAVYKQALWYLLLF